MNDTMLAEYCVKDVQKLLRKMLNEFLNICEKNSIKYYLVKGGLIGAVKYKGFIPWDPDVDFAIHLSDLNLFCESARKELNKPFKLCFYDNDNNYEYLFPRISIEGIDYRQLHLDIFILCHCPNEANNQLRFLKKISRIELLNTFRNSNINRPINSLLNRIALIVSRIFIFWIPKNYVRKKHIRIASSISASDYYIQIGAVGEYKEKYIMPVQWFGDGVKREFDLFNVLTPERTDEYLEKMYPGYLHSLPKQSDIKRQENRKWHFDSRVVEALTNVKD